MAVMRETPYGAFNYLVSLGGPLQSDASHGPTPLNWYDVSVPSKTKQLGQTWPTLHWTTASYYPVLVSHAVADGRLFIRGARGIFCYDLRRKD